MGEQAHPDSLGVLGDLALARGEHDRAAHIRTDDEALARLWADPTTRVLRLSRSHVEVDGDRNLRWSAATECPNDVERYFLGLHAGVAYFAAALNEESEEFHSATLRELGAVLSDLEVGLVVQAVALAQWHAVHSHCARCGAASQSWSAGASRRCLVCDVEHYPRTDPAVIVLVRDREDRILLGRQAVWPKGRYSTFAGFVEPGESFEAAVEREVLEEAGVAVSEVIYMGSQPWPFPASIMIAYSAFTDAPDSAKPDGTEIEEIRWFSRQELVDAISREEVLLPPSISIARRMIEAWYGGPLQGGQAWR